MDTKDIEYEFNTLHVQFEPGRLAPDGYEHVGLLTVFDEEFSTILEMQTWRDVAGFLMAHESIIIQVAEMIDNAYQRGLNEGAEGVREAIRSALNIPWTKPVPSYSKIPEPVEKPSKPKYGPAGGVYARFLRKQQPD